MGDKVGQLHHEADRRIAGPAPHLVVEADHILVNLRQAPATRQDPPEPDVGRVRHRQFGLEQRNVGGRGRIVHRQQIIGEEAQPDQFADVVQQAGGEELLRHRAPRRRPHDLRGRADGDRVAPERLREIPAPRFIGQQAQDRRHQHGVPDGAVPEDADRPGNGRDPFGQRVTRRIDHPQQPRGEHRVPRKELRKLRGRRGGIARQRLDLLIDGRQGRQVVDAPGQIVHAITHCPPPRTARRPARDPPAAGPPPRVAGRP